MVNCLWDIISEGLSDKWRPNVFYVLDKKEVETINEKEIVHNTALTTKDLADEFKWSPQAVRKALCSLGIVEKGLT